MRLSDLPIRSKATVDTLDHDDEGHWRKLVALGISPGTEITVIQRWPAIVVRAGNTEVALDHFTSRLVHLRHAQES